MSAAFAAGPARVSHGGRTQAAHRRRACAAGDACGVWRASTSSSMPRAIRCGCLVFLSEVKAQRLAVRLRQQSHVGSLPFSSRSCWRRIAAHPARPAATPAADRPSGRRARRRQSRRARPAAGDRAPGVRRQDAGMAHRRIRGVRQEQSAEVAGGVRGSGRWRHVRLHDRTSRRPERTGAGAGAKGCRDREHRRRDRQGTPPTVRVDAVPGQKRD